MKKLHLALLLSVSTFPLPTWTAYEAAEEKKEATAPSIVWSGEGFMREYTLDKNGKVRVIWTSPAGTMRFEQDENFGPMRFIAKNPATGEFEEQDGLWDLMYSGGFQRPYFYQIKAK